jgi:MOSC domain-containing protein YiiM
LNLPSAPLFVGMNPSPAAIVHLYVSPGHNYVGHHGGAPGTHEMVEVDQLICVPGRGIKGDRFFDYRPDYRGQITFFALEIHEDLCLRLARADRPPSVYRRNVVTRGLDLNALVGVEFQVQGVRFCGSEECRPCHWMDQSFGPNAESLLTGRGGLRARILTSGNLRIGPV